MRISIDTDDPGFSLNAITATVYLDGVRLHNCITADTEKGECLCYDHEALPSGNFVPTIIRTGSVKIDLA